MFRSLHNNSFSGSIPDFSNLPSLTELDLGENKLTGTIPTSLTKLTNLAILGLLGNEFSGSIPNSIAALSTRANHIYLSYNCLSGGIPTTANNATIDYYPQDRTCSNDINPPSTGGIGGVGGNGGNGGSGGVGGTAKSASKKSSVVSKSVFAGLVVLGAFLRQL
ncbi:hypothetical protein HDU76_006947 [Blyttiomyces sp. JEL0837]|nr:hypothetical protein HDU76_006947 [Blyttiomyces sp. JEL0837]